MPYRFFSMIEYNDGKGQRYFNVLFNETLAFTEANVAFDVELIATYLLIIGFVAGMGYLAYTCFQKKTVCKPLFFPPHLSKHYFIVSHVFCACLQCNAMQGKGKKAAAAKAAAPAAPVAHEKNEWLVGTAAHEHMKREKKERKSKKN